jgi:hypothetical protein
LAAETAELKQISISVGTEKVREGFSMVTRSKRATIRGSERIPVPGARAAGAVPKDERFEVTVRVRRRTTFESLAADGFHADEATLPSSQDLRHNPPERTTFMKPVLNHEYIQRGEDEVFDEMVRLTIGQMNTTSDGRRLRVQHAKATGCVSAKFQVSDDISDDLRHGVFRDPGRTYDAIVRFSNSQGTIEPDGEGTVRGLAIKLLDVTGDRAIQHDRDRSQDFLMVDHPVFLFPNPKAYLDIMSRKSVPLIGKLFAAAHLAIFERDELAMLKAMKGKRVASPLEITYWSGSPFWLGDAEGRAGQAVKYSAVPRERHLVAPAEPEQMPSDYLGQAITKHLAEREALFDFKVQIQTDPIAMPVEDVSVEWDERVSPPVTLATLRIGIQTVDPNGDFEEKCDSMSFSPWHALAEHRPLGGINRLRKAVYKASFNHRVGHGESHSD